MKEIIFDNGLVIQYRKNAVFFMYENNVNDNGYTYPFWKDQTPYVERDELEKDFTMNEKDFYELLQKMKFVSSEAWGDGSVEPKLATNSSMDYWEYYDRDFDSNGYLTLRNNKLSLDGPAQPKTKNKYNRLYKFDKRKMASFIYDLEKIVNSQNG